VLVVREACLNAAGIPIAECYDWRLGWLGWVVNAPREEVLGEAQVLWVRIGLTYSRQAGAESRFEAARQMLKQAVERLWNDVILSEA